MNFARLLLFAAAFNFAQLTFAKGILEFANDSKNSEKIQNVMTISDADYDSLREQVLTALAEDNLIVRSEYSIDNIGLGYDRERKSLIIESKPSSKYLLKLIVFSDRVVVQDINGGTNFRLAVESYFNEIASLANNDLFSQLNLIAGTDLDLPFLIAVLNKSVTPFAIDLSEFERKHYPASAISLTVEKGPNAGREMTLVQFNKVDFDYSRVSPGPGIAIDNFGNIRFSPAVKLGSIESENAIGSCVRVCESGGISCLENIDQKSCMSQDAFGGRVRCPVKLEWNQNLSCEVAQRLVD